MLKYDCKYFSGDRPCDFHKNYNIKCDGCSHYSPITFKILIIKLDAIGDVLRTTSILEPLKKKYPGSQITWCTKCEARDIFINNDLVDDVIFVEEDAYFRVKAEEYDLVINLDTSKFSSAIASSAIGKSKMGFILDKKGYVKPTSDPARQWLHMSAFDDVKKENKKSYQEIIYEIIELKSNVELPVLNVPDAEINKIKTRSKSWKLLNDTHTIGLNIGVGTKWPSKSWPLQRWEQFILSLQNKSVNILLLGGANEKEKMNHLSTNYKFIVNTGYQNSIMEFAAIVNLCDVIVTADTFALHIATALNKKTVVLFGPTSNREIYLYGSGFKVISTKECKCYYKRECTDQVSCMSEIKESEVLAAINSLIG